MAVTMVGVFSESRMLMVVALATMTMVIGVGIMLMRHDTFLYTSQRLLIRYSLRCRSVIQRAVKFQHWAPLRRRFWVGLTVLVTTRSEARQSMGIGPLPYARRGDADSFARHVRALLSHRIPGGR